MVGQQLVDSLQEEVIRLRALLEASQREVYGNILEKARLFQDPVIGEILRLRREVESRGSHEADLLLALEETKEEMAILKRTDDALLEEAGV